MRRVQWVACCSTDSKSLPVLDRVSKSRAARASEEALNETFARGLAAHQQGDRQQAREAYLQVLAQRPDSAPCLQLLGVLEHMEGDSVRGLALLRRAYALAPTDRDIRQNLANLLSDIEQLEEAALLYRGLIAEQPGQWFHHANLSAALRRMGHFEDARASACKALAIDSRQPLAWMAKGNAEACARRIDEAIASYEQVIALQPGLFAAHHSLCRLLLQQEQRHWWSRRRLSRTRRAYQRWAEADPHGTTARFMLQALQGDALPARMPDEVVRATFDHFAPDFERQLAQLDYCGPQRVMDALERAGIRQGADLQVLDAGCGTGLAGPLLRPLARRLVGVDLSPPMLGKAKAKGCYDQLEEGELASWLGLQSDCFDLLVSVDVLNYFGELESVLRAAAGALRPGGRIAFTVERSAQPGYCLTCAGRYAHHRDYVAQCLASAGFEQTVVESISLRKESGQPVQAWLFLSSLGTG